jgi:hypothetical protein
MVAGAPYWTYLTPPPHSAAAHRLIANCSAFINSAYRFQSLFMGDFHCLHDPVHDLIGVGIRRRAAILQIR